MRQYGKYFFIIAFFIVRTSETSGTKMLYFENTCSRYYFLNDVVAGTCSFSRFLSFNLSDVGQQNGVTSKDMIYISNFWASVPGTISFWRFRTNYWLAAGVVFWNFQSHLWFWFEMSLGSFISNDKSDCCEVPLRFYVYLRWKEPHCACNAQLDEIRCKANNSDSNLPDENKGFIMTIKSILKKLAKETMGLPELLNEFTTWSSFGRRDFCWSRECHLSTATECGAKISFQRPRWMPELPSSSILVWNTKPRKFAIFLWQFRPIQDWHSCWPNVYFPYLVAERKQTMICNLTSHSWLKNSISYPSSWDFYQMILSKFFTTAVQNEEGMDLKNYLAQKISFPKR